MYSEHFGLKEMPFSIAPDPRYLYLSEQHREALAHLIYGINSDGGFVLLTGEVGTGKTTVCRCLIEQIPEKTEVAFVINPKLTVEELLATICDDLCITYPEGNTSIKVFVDRINAYLLDAHTRGHRTVLIIDEAQNLSSNVLEQLRLLTNLETNKHKLLQIILLGQPELKEILERTELRQLSQRITARYHLGPLSEKDVAAYISHRLSIAGLRDQVFPPTSLSRLFKLSRGIPRLINLLCDRALLGAFSLGEQKVTKVILEKAAREVFGKHGHNEHRSSAPYWVLTFLILIFIGVVLIPVYQNTDTLQPSPIDTAPPPQSETLKWPDGQPSSSSKAMAFQTLFTKWDIPYMPEMNGTACQHASTQGLRCMFTKGSLGSLSKINRPAVLQLFDEQGSDFYATLISLSDESVTVVLGTETRTVPLHALNTQWLGNYILLWKIPPGYTGHIKPGDQGPVIPWIDQQIALVNKSKPLAREDMVFDEPLIARVRAFQLAEGLLPDGIVGPQTIIHLNTATGQGIPALRDGEMS
jgi:general secretion pathway protein A